MQTSRAERAVEKFKSNCTRNIRMALMCRRPVFFVFDSQRRGVKIIAAQ